MRICNKRNYTTIEYWGPDGSALLFGWIDDHALDNLAVSSGWLSSSLPGASA